MIMERKIGEIFEYNGAWYQCVKDDYPFNCNECCFYNRGDKKCSEELTGYCSSGYRSDWKEIIFKKLEKVGEPYDDCGTILQRFRIHTNVTNADTKGLELHIYSNNTIGIEIKQKQEDMEEKKLNLKPFDIQKAREGKSVCTRDGRKARIICFDYNGETGDYPIVALVHYNKGNKCYERVLEYTSDGLFNKYGDCQHDDDLMMLPEKKEGWVNVYKGGLLDTKSYNTKKEAFDKASPKNYIDTVKIEWYE